MTNNEYAASLRLIADFYDANPDMPQSRGIWLFSSAKEEFLRAVKCMARGGRVEKSADNPEYHSYPQYRAKRIFGSVPMEVQIARSTVCRLVRPAEYECPDSLLGEAAEYTEVKA